MSTTITGNQVTLTIATVAYTAQVTSAVVTRDDTQETFDVLGARVYRTLTFPYTLEMTILPDWGATASLCQALSSAALTAPDTSLAMVLKAEDGETEETVLEGAVFPEVVDMAGAGFALTEVTVTLTGDRNVPLEFNPTP
jgi:hypothetical protein